MTSTAVAVQDDSTGESDNDRGKYRAGIVLAEAVTKGGTATQLVTQKYGGARWTHGVPAETHKAGPGRRPNALKKMMRGNLTETIPVAHAEWLAGAIPTLDYQQHLADIVLDDRRSTMPVSVAEQRAYATAQADADLTTALKALIPVELHPQAETLLAGHLSRLQGIWRGE